MSKPENYSTATSETLSKRVSIRKYRDEAIPDAMLHTILNAARRSPTSSNMQAYSLIVIRNPETKAKLAASAGNQEWIRTCDVFLAICADIHRLEQACLMHGATLGKNLELSLLATVDASLVGMSIATVAESFGLGHVMIGGMRNRPQYNADLLGCPSGVFVVYGMCLGFPDQTKIPAQKPRLPESVVIHHEQYQAVDREALQDHDEALAKHYEKQGRNLNKAAWTGVMADKFGQYKRPELRQTLEAMGFKFD